MKSSSKLACFRSMTLLGCFLAMAPSFVSWYWGNLSVYTHSYIRARQGPDADSFLQTPLTIPVSVISAPIGVTLSDFIRKYLGTHGTPLLACLAYSFALAISYFTIHSSIILFEILLGFVTGLSFAIIYSHVLWVVREWCNSRYIGFYTGLVSSGAGLGPLIMNQLITWYINPSNRIPDFRTGHNAFFTQDEILTRVPSVFLVLCGFALSVFLLGILLIRDVKHASLLQDEFDLQSEGAITKHYSEEQIVMSSHLEDSTKLTDLFDSKQSHIDNDRKQHLLKTNSGADFTIPGCPSTSSLFNSASIRECNRDNLLKTKSESNNLELEENSVTNSSSRATDSHDNDFDGKKTQGNKEDNHTDKHEFMNKPEVTNEENSAIPVRHDQTKRYRAVSDSSNGTRNALSGESLAGEGVDKPGYQTESNIFEDLKKYTNAEDLSPLQVLKTATFYIICLCATCSDLNLVLINTYYKAYGELYVKDDHFLAGVGTTILIGFIITRIIWGLMVDYFGIKNTLIFLISGFAIGLALWYFTILVDKWFYLIWTVMVGTLNGGYYFVFAMCSLKLFGHKYYIRNIGLILASTIPFNVASPYIIGLILSHSGYSTLFLTGSSLSTWSLILVVFFIPKM